MLDGGDRRARARAPRRRRLPPWKVPRRYVIEQIFSDAMDLDSSSRSGEVGTETELALTR